MTGVSVVSMPWAAPDRPSIQIGLLTALAVEAGLPVTAHSLHLEAADFFASNGIELADFERVVHRWWTVALGEWIFAGSVGGAGPDGDPSEPAGAPAPRAADHVGYVGYLRGRQVPEPVIATALAMRQLVPAFLDQAAEEILTGDPAVVGFTTTFSQTVPSLSLAAALKQRRPELVVMLGGANCDGELGVTLHRTCPAVDVVIQAEAEPVFADLCAEVLAGRPPRARPGVLVRDVVGAGSSPPLRSDMAAVPAPVYGEYFERLARSDLRSRLAPRARLVVETSRGCWWGERNHCTFCGLNGSSMTYRVKPGERVIAQIETLARLHHRTEFDVVDNILDPSFFDDVLPALVDRRRAGYDYRFFYETKANLTPVQVRRLREAGVHRIQPGIESLSTPILRRMAKGVTAIQNVRLLVFAARYDVLVTWNVIYGIPGETAADYAAMAELVPSLMHLKPPGLARLQVQRFSPYFDRPKQYGLRLLGPAGYYRHLYDVPAEDLPGLAYVFEHEYLDGHDPEEAVAPFRRALEEWDRHWTPGSHGSLRYERGPGYLRLRDRRGATPHRDIFLDDIEADLYLACLTGATPAAASALLARERAVSIDAGEVRELLEELTRARLMFREGDWFLALALPLTPDADPPQLLQAAWKLSLSGVALTPAP